MSVDSRLRRKLLIYFLGRLKSLSLKEIEEKMGGMSDGAVCQVVGRLVGDWKKNQELFDIVRKLEARFCKM